jgi:hypothetical protein
MGGYPAVKYCVSSWVMVVLCTCLACCSLCFVSVGYAYKLILTQSGESLSVFGFSVVGCYALLQAGSFLCGVSGVVVDIQLGVRESEPLFIVGLLLGSC